MFFYGANSEVAWLFLLAYWIAALIVAAYAYARWNWRGLRARVEVGAGEPGPTSPVDELPEQLLRSGPLPAPIFEGDRVEIELRLETVRAARGPARLTGLVGGAELAAATGLVSRSGWTERRVIGPVRRGPINAEGWTLEAGDPLGLFRRRRQSHDAEVALALPRFTSLTRQPRVSELEASMAAPRSGSGTELFGVREYRPGDPLRRIHWRSSARHAELIVREYEPPGVQSLGIFCDSEPATPEVADQIARLAASEAWDCIRAGGRVVLWGPGMEPSRPGDARSLWPLLEWLARYPHTPEGGGAAEEYAPRVAAAVAVVGGIDPIVADALEQVRHRGGAVRAWVVGDAEVEIEAQLTRVGTAWPL